jgi:hypothetical protein
MNTTRRRFLRQTFAFSALAAGWSRHALATPANPAAQHMLLIGDWGYTGDLSQQTAVAKGMQSYVAQQGIKTGALFFLGDNFYGKFDGHVKCPRWKTQFEDMYPRMTFDCPCYAILGNHDYHVEPADKLDAQLAYAKQGGTRWTMPAKWYRFDFPQQNPLVTFLALDSNYQKSSEGKLSLTDDERAAQNDWFKAELAKPRTTPFLAIAGHHPIYSNGIHGDTAALVSAWEPLLRESRAHLYLGGHDHDMQHLEFGGHPTSFVLSGGGGAKLYPLLRTAEDRGPYAQSIAGFTHLEVTAQSMIIRHLDPDGKVLHAFSKTPAGQVTVL